MARNKKHKHHVRDVDAEVANNNNNSEDEIAVHDDNRNNNDNGDVFNNHTSANNVEHNEKHKECINDKSNTHHEHNKNDNDKEIEDGKIDDKSVEKAVSTMVITRQPPVQVLYCPICTFPAEMCEFSGMYEKCRPWLQEHAAELAEAEERGRKRRVLTEKDRLEAMVEGRGVKKAVERVVIIESVLNKGKVMTLVTGMDLFGFNLKDLLREWRKSFACGGGIRDAETGQQFNSIQLQGKIENQLAELLVTKYKIPRTAIMTMNKKQKVPFFD